MAGQAIPASLAAEGRMMLQTLLNDLKPLSHIELLLPLDRRFQQFELPERTEIVWLDSGDHLLELLPTWLARCDAVWPIAPETDGLLRAIAVLVEQARKTLLLSASDAVAVCGDKLTTARILSEHGLHVVETRRLIDCDRLPFPATVIKPRDGVGCEGSRIVASEADYRHCVDELEDTQNYIAQPLHQGAAMSLSCLFQRGRGWLICCNRQQVEIVDRQFCLTACVVNVEANDKARYTAIVEQVAAAMPALWGYVGIDLIETDRHQPIILEINPRLTTSYAGIRHATGINVAEQTLRLLTAEPELTASENSTVTIDIDK